MRYCSHCGKELVEAAVICVGCGCAVEQSVAVLEPCAATGLQIAAKVLLIIETVFRGIFLLPLAWCLPMTLSYCKKIKTGQPVGTGFKVCVLIFVSTIAGILMLCDSENKK